MSFPIKHLFIDRSVSHYPSVERIRNALKAPWALVDGPDAAYQVINAAEDPVAMGKEVLLLTRNRGPYIRPCPGTRKYRCCDYTILHIGTYCTMDCAYCVLQGYFHPPLLQLFVNHEALDRELDRAFGDKAFRRIGTGEFTDSLIWEPWTDLVPGLIMRFGKQNHMILELKTKTVMVDRLKGLPHRRRTVVSWSMNTPEMIRQNERATATLESRLKAAGKCQSWGYPLAFHFDPVILYEGAEDDYNRVIDRLFSVVSPENIAWISIGSFRFSAELKPIIEKRFPSSKIVYGELITGMDDKFRYFKPLRIKLYAKMVSRIRRYAPSTTVYFCMEDDRTWRQVMGFVPSDIGGLGALLDNSVTDVCGLNSA